MKESLSYWEDIQYIISRTDYLLHVLYRKALSIILLESFIPEWVNIELEDLDEDPIVEINDLADITAEGVEVFPFDTKQTKSIIFPWIYYSDDITDEQIVEDMIETISAWIDNISTRIRNSDRRMFERIKAKYGW